MEHPAVARRHSNALSLAKIEAAIDSTSGSELLEWSQIARGLERHGETYPDRVYVFRIRGPKASESVGTLDDPSPHLKRLCEILVRRSFADARILRDYLIPKGASAWLAIASTGENDGYTALKEWMNRFTLATFAQLRRAGVQEGIPADDVRGWLYAAYWCMRIEGLRYPEVVETDWELTKLDEAASLVLGLPSTARIRITRVVANAADALATEARHVLEALAATLAPSRADVGARPTGEPKRVEVVLWEGADPSKRNVRLARTRTAYLEAGGNVASALESLRVDGHRISRRTFYNHLDALDRTCPGWRREVQLCKEPAQMHGMRTVGTRKKSRGVSG